MAFNLAFVDKIDASPTVRLNLNSGSYGVRQRPDFTPPPLRRAVADSGVLRDGAEVPASAYDNRTIRFRLHVTGTSADNLATNLQTLFRELDRTRNILRFDTGQTNPVFFRTFRSTATALDGEYPDNKAVLDVEIYAEPFGYGLRQDFSSITFEQDPAAGTNGAYFDLSGGIGDVETPLFFEITRPTGAGNNLGMVVLGRRARGTPSDLVFFMQGESGTLGTDASITASGTHSGGNYVTVSFATTTTDAERLRFVWPATSPTSGQKAAMRGTYRVWVRGGVNSSTTTCNIYWRLQDATSTVDTNLLNGPTKTVTGATGGHWLDLGLMQIPPGSLPDGIGYSGRDPIAERFDLILRAARTSGSGSFLIDYVLLVPADEEYFATDFQSTGSTTMDITRLYFDGPRDQVYAGVAGALAGTGGLGIWGPGFGRAGAPLSLKPNQTNRFIGFMAASDLTLQTLTSDFTFVASYWPRYLYIRP